jgi:hypothetical protein
MPFWGTVWSNSLDAPLLGEAADKQYREVFQVLRW